MKSDHQSSIHEECESVSTHKVSDSCTVRSFALGDQDAVSRLWTTGLLWGTLDPDDTAADLEFVEHSYGGSKASHLWVSESQGQIIGMVGVACDDDHVAEIRRLRVVSAWRRTALAKQLLDTALTHCRKHGFLKVIIDTHVRPDWAVLVLARHGYEHSRTRNYHGKSVSEFYTNLYVKQLDESDSVQLLACISCEGHDGHSMDITTPTNK